MRLTFKNDIVCTYETINLMLSIVNTEDEMHTDLSTWTPAERKKLQHMT